MLHLLRFFAKAFKASARGITTVLNSLIGHLAWQPPWWLRRSCSAIAGRCRSRPRSAAAAIVLGIAILSGSIWTWNWYQRQPKPRKVVATLAAIPVTPLEKTLKFPPLRITFSESAARLEDLRQPALRRVRLEPALAGNWRWMSDRELVFQPEEDWPAEREFRVAFEKSFFPRHVLIERHQHEFMTPPFAAKIASCELAEDAREPGVQRVIAKIELTHSVAARELEKHVSLVAIGGSRIFPDSDQPPHFTIVYGLHNREAWIRSSPLVLPEKEDWLRVSLSKKVRTFQGGAQTDAEVESKALIPARHTAFAIKSAQADIVRNKEGGPEQVLHVETRGEIGTTELAKALSIRLLPKKPLEKEESEATEGAERELEEESDSHEGDGDADEEEAAEAQSEPRWESPAEITDELLAQAKPIAFTALPSDRKQDRIHHFRFRVEAEGELFVQVAKGVRSAGGYELAENYTNVVAAPELPREIAIEGEGGVLALTGERKLSIRSRGVPVIRFEIYRVRADQINHLVSQTEGEFQAPEFLNHSFDESNISRIAREEQPIRMQNRWQTNYSAFDFSGHLNKPADGGSERGLFFLKGRGWDPAKKRFLEMASVSRFVLVTDLGLLVKKNADRSSNVFVVSIKTGQPIAGAAIELLGKNGIAVQAAQTSADGRASLGPIEKGDREKKPVAYVARLADDISFIPYARDDRALNFSRFDIGGIEDARPEELDAFVFTERGVYRPGEEMHVGVIVKQRSWQQPLAGVPIEAEIVDARGRKVQTTKLSLPATGFVEFTHRTTYESPTGAYTINAFVINGNKRTTVLGSTSVHVKEFLPDRMKIEARLSKNSPRGWVSPEAMRASITLANLYGTAASDRRIKSHLVLSPARFRFPEFPDHQFYDPLLEEKKERGHESIDLGERNTDAEGAAEVDLQLERFADATYAMRFYAEGFEGDGGRSVFGQASALVSALPYVLGYKADGDLRYVEANTPRVVELISVDPQLNRIALENVTVEVIAQEFISVLALQKNGNYAYESVLKERVVKSEQIALGADGLRYQLPTAEPGDYVIDLRTNENRRLNKIRFSVVGRGTAPRALERNSELQVKLDRAHYNTGEEIAVSITAPYAGSGLITIERDRVYAQAWFKTDATSSVQRIRVPEGFEGSGYINVAFIRALDSKEIFASPLSYGVVPFTANTEKRRLKIDLETAPIAKPGEPFRIRYRTDRPSKIALFAVDKGILQVSDFELPNPLAHFFRKCALGVETSQIVDLIIPEFSILRSTSAFGGDGDVKQLNPFKRVTEKPVVFWSGIVDGGPESREVVYEVPDYFNGTLTVMAVAVSEDAVGSAEREALLRGPFVITSSVPTLAAPGDEFEVGITVANNVERSGVNAEVQLAVEASEHFETLTKAKQKMSVAEGREHTTTVRLRVKEKLGSGEIKFTASIGGTESRLRSTVSVRPPTPFMTQVRSGNFAKRLDLPLTRAMHPEFRKTTAAVSAVPLGLAHGLDAYLKAFPHGCSEQISSGALTRLMLADEADFGLSRAEVAAQIEHTFSVLRRRQNDQGAIGYWAPENSDGISFVSVYAMHFLIEAKAAGFAPPAEMFASGLRHLRGVATKEARSAEDARVIAYAIYLLTREGVVTTNHILNLRDYLEKHQFDEWQGSLTGVYLAGALQILHKKEAAEKLIARYRMGDRSHRGWNDFHQPLSADAQYLAVVAREFPARMQKISGAELEHLLRPIGEGNFSTLSAAYAVVALKAYSRAIAQQPPELTIAELDSRKRETRLVNSKKLLQQTAFSGDVAAVRFQSATLPSGAGAFFQLVEAGFDRQLPKEPLTNGLEVYRELLNATGQPVTQTRLGEPVSVRIRARSLRSQAITNVAIIDLLPGGFEVVGTSLQPGSATAGADYVEVREDRAVFFATIPSRAVEFRYQIKSCNRGEFVVPPVFAESMYDRNLKARGMSGKISVTQ